MLSVKTYSPKASEITRAWHIVDADGMTIGRMATEVARLLKGKHKPTYATHMDSGDFVVVVNAEKVVMTSNKMDRQLVHRHSGYPGGLKTITYRQLVDAKPAEAVRKAIKGMLPHGPLGRAMGLKLKVYAGTEHPHAAQQPVALPLQF